MISSTPSPLFHQLDLWSIHFSRRQLKEQTPPASGSPQTQATNPVDPTVPYNGTSGFDADAVMILLVLLCALICSLGLNSIIKCALRFSRLASTQPTTESKPTGIQSKALKSFAVVNYSPDLNLPGVGTECVICLSEFTLAERVRILPKCNHGFHVRCIDKWLNTHSSCPTCRHCLIEVCQKIVGGCDQPSSSQPTTEPQQLTQETVINIVPLEHEDFTRSYRRDR